MVLPLDPQCVTWYLQCSLSPPYHLSLQFTRWKSCLNQLMLYKLIVVDLCVLSLVFCFPQALGCVLYLLCFNEHPFADSAKLRIINANYTIPDTDTEYSVFHDLISKLLTRCRFYAHIFRNFSNIPFRWWLFQNKTSMLLNLKLQLSLVS